MLIDLDAQHLALVGLSWQVDLFVIQTCVACSCYDTVYMETDGQGSPVWSEHNAMPYGAGDIDYNKH
ncbi:hypothetical protein AAXB25_34090 [Paenibacillus lautus]|uniref:hypothetical protein n=1 Tax=Paenibacillus lautus TaxID=1401 RepID=UPI003D2BD40F